MTTNKNKLLIVDDSPIIIIRLMHMLEGQDNVHSITAARSYNEARSSLSENLPNIILLDINLPDKNGIELLRYIKKEYPSITVIMLSNQSGSFYRTVCELIGANHYIDKSTEFEQIPALLSSFG